MQKSSNQFTHHYEETITVAAAAEEVFAFADNHNNFSSHMNKPSLMMGGGMMTTNTDAGKGQQVGSHITMSGSAFGIKIFLDEIITVHEPPTKKEWQTVGELKILVIGHYVLGFEIIPQGDESQFRVYIDYTMPKNFPSNILAWVLHKTYAKWCVQQMTKGVQRHFSGLSA